MGRKKEIPGFFTPEFWYIVKIWRMFNAGFGLPGGLSWDELNPDLADILLEFQQCHQYNFSQEALAIKYQEALLKNFQAFFKAMGKR